MAPPPALIRVLDEEVRASFQSLHDSYFHQLVAYGIAVALGIVLELPEVIKGIREAFTGWKPAKSVDQIIALVGVVGWLMVAGGVAGETICEALVFSADTLVQSFDSGLLTDAQGKTALALEDAESAKALTNGYQAQIADSNARAKTAEARVSTATAASDDAVARVKTADARIAEAERGAAEARERTASLEVEALSLREKLANQGARENLITGDKRRDLVVVLKKFAGQKIDVRYSANAFLLNGTLISSSPLGEDSRGLADALVGVMHEAGWSLPETALLFNGQGNGVEVDLVSGALPSTRNAAQALVKALQSIPLAVSGPFDITDSNRTDRVGSAEKLVIPVLDANTIVLAVLTHPK